MSRNCLFLRHLFRCRSRNILSKNLKAIMASSYHSQPEPASGKGDDVYRVNLRSDTFTLPTAAMKEAMVTAELGDDVYGEDPTVNKLQETCAALLGQEAALLVPTGTMGNIASIITHCNHRFEEVLLGDQSHIYWYEVGGISTIAGVQPRSIKNNPDGTLDLADLQDKIRPRTDPHFPWTRLICLENTHNRCGGSVLSVEYIKKVREIADANDIKMHLDGARVMNAAAALGVPVSEITKHFDSVSMCFSKGLSCPVGSVMAGSKDFIKRAMWARKALGGGMRQAGVIAAPMLVALRDIAPQLGEDQARARRIAQAVAELGSNSVLSVDMGRIQTNILIMQTQGNVTTNQVCQRLLETPDEEISALGEKIVVQTVPFSATNLRFVTYHGITDKDTDKAIKKIQYVCLNMQK